MKEVYEAPEAEIEILETEDVLSISIVKDEKGHLSELDWKDLK